MSNYASMARFPDCPFMETRCFAFRAKNNREKCIILRDTNFDGDRKKCPFFKTQEQFDADLKKYPYPERMALLSKSKTTKEFLDAGK